MSNVQFEGDFDPGQKTAVQFNPGQGNFSNSYAQRPVRGMTGWLLEKGIIKNESQAKVLLLGIVVFNLLVTAFVIYHFIF